MGGKKRGAPRQKQRAKLVAEEHLLATTTAGTVIESQADQDLFVIDNVGDEKLSKRIANEEKKKKKEKGTPKQLGFKVKKIMKTHENNPSQIQSMAKNAKNKRDLKTLKREQRKIKRTNFDLWGDEGNDDNHILNIDPTYNPNISKKKSIKVVPVVKGTSSSMGGTAPITFRAQTKAQLQNPTILDFGSKSKSKKLMKKREHEKQKARPSVAVDVALPGQSYLPDQEQHQDAIGEALTIEIRRKEAEEEKKAPIGGADGMNEETLAVLTHDPYNSSDDDDTDDSDDDEDNDTHKEEIKFQPQKNPGKLTTAKRNKQKRARQQELESKARKKQKQFLHSITEVKKIHKEFNQQERERVEKKAVIDELKKEELAKPLGTQLYTKRVEVDPLNVPSLPVALTEEIQRGKYSELDENGNPVTTNSGLYSLRTVKPKGSLLKERLESLADRKMANRKKLRKKRVVQGKRRKPGKVVDIFF